MTEPKTIFVVVPEPKAEVKGGDGVEPRPAEEPRSYLVHRNDNPHGGQQFMTHESDPMEVVNSTDIRRRIRSGDLRIATEADFAKAKARAAKREEEAKKKAAEEAKAKAEADAAAKKAK